MGSALRPFLAGCALTALVAGAAWWLNAAPAAATGDAKQAPPAPPADTSIDIGVTDNPPPPPPEPRRVVVRILDAEDEHPLAGAKVEIRVGGCEAPSFDGTSIADAEGRAQFALPAGDEGLEVFVTAANHVYAALEPEDVDATAAEIVVALAPAGSVRGVVRDADGRPVDGVSVEAEIDGHGGWPDDDVLTEGGGAYRIDGIEVGADFSVVIADNGRLASRHGLVVTSGGEVVTADLTLSIAASLRVRVLWPDGLPVVGANIDVQPSGDAAETDDSGEAEIGALPAGKHHVLVSRAGFADAEANVDLAPGETRTVDLRPAPNAVLAGVVVDDADFPIGGAIVTIDADGDVRTRTRSDGSFRMACRDEDPHDLVVTHEGHCDTTVAGVTAPAEDLRIVVARRPKLRCRLVLPAGVKMPRHVAAWWEHRLAANAVENGVLTIDVAPGPGRASFQVPGCVVVDREIEAAPGQVVDLGDVVLVAAPKLRGRVVDEKGRAVEGFVYAKVGGAQVPLTSTDEHGAFEFDGLPAGAAELRVEAKGFVERTVHLAFTPGMEPEVIVLKRGGGVKGRVVDAEGKPAPKAVYVSFVSVDESANKDRQATPSIEDDGTFEVHLTPGRYTASTTLDNTQGSAEVEVVDGKTCEVTITLR